MDNKEVEQLKIAQILPEFHEGGVERHVLWLSNALAELGHEVTVISAGGKLEEKINPGVVCWRLPVHRKNPFTGFYSASRIAYRAKREGWDILHAHSRVPAWIAWWVSLMAGIPWVLTAHARYSLNSGLLPFVRANGAISGSKAGERHLCQYLPEKRIMIRNGLPHTGHKWKGSGGKFKHLLFVGRLARIKGLQVVLEALPGLKDREWELDVLGDGPQRAEFEEISRNLGINRKVHFHGFCDDPEEWMSKSDLLIFPSFDEGMPLVLMQAIQVGLPALASDIEPVRELVGDDATLLLPGDVETWARFLSEIFENRFTPPVFDPVSVPTDHEMAGRANVFYGDILDPPIKE